MTCPVCEDTKLKCIESRPRHTGTYRRYVCPKCAQRYSTLELFESKADNAVTAALQEQNTIPAPRVDNIRDRLEHPWKYK
jgi:transcriptional regulator NrdR family protein